MATLLAAVTGTTAVDHAYRGVVFALILVGAVIAGRFVVPVPERFGWLVGAAVAGFFLGVLALVSAGPAILDVHVREARATVTAESAGEDGKATVYDYDLAVDGVPLPGYLTLPDDELDTGQTVDVRYDPAGYAHPERTADHKPGTILVGIPVVAIVWGLAALAYREGVRRPMEERAAARLEELLAERRRRLHLQRTSRRTPQRRRKP
ncbi:MAG: hypothetical protein HOV83_22005 [Catenulispora sp.]|nr:hypothetical protein [Catenulispora sp.]